MSYKIFDKRGQVHVEMILSFVIFVGFVGFLFWMFNPFDNSVSPSYVETVVFDKINKNVSSVVHYVSLKIDSGIRNEVVSIANIEELDCVEGKMIVRNSEDVVDSEFKNGRIVFSREGEYFFTIYCSDDLVSDSSVSGEKPLDDDEYTLGMIVDKEAWAESKLDIFRAEYNGNYNSFKRNFVSGGDDFGLVVSSLDGEGNFFALRNQPESLEVYAQVFPIELVNSDAEFEIAKARVLFW